MSPENIVHIVHYFDFRKMSDALWREASNWLNGREKLQFMHISLQSLLCSFQQTVGMKKLVLIKIICNLAPQKRWVRQAVTLLLFTDTSVFHKIGINRWDGTLKQSKLSIINFMLCIKLFFVIPIRRSKKYKPRLNHPLPPTLLPYYIPIFTFLYPSLHNATST